MAVAESTAINPARSVVRSADSEYAMGGLLPASLISIDLAADPEKLVALALARAVHLERLTLMLATSKQALAWEAYEVAETLHPLVEDVLAVVRAAHESLASEERSRRELDKAPTLKS